MNKEQLQAEYQKLAGQAGDAFFKWQTSKKQTDALAQYMDSLTKQKDQLERALVDVAKQPAKEEASSAVDPATSQS